MNAFDNQQNNKPLTEEQQQLDLLAGIANRNKSAMQRFYQCYRGKLASFLFRMVGSHSLVEEIFNDTMLAVWQQPERFEGRSKVSTWVYAIAYRQCLNRIAKEKKHRSVSSFDEEEGVYDSVNDDQVDLVKKALGNLSQDHRSVIELSYYLGCNYSEIANIMGCPENTVKTRMFHARKKLKAVISSLDVAVSIGKK